ncbi:MAG: 1-acyl-sn-glycerol-3-phosphate acyltransferase [Rhodothalassiaceae bacterium]
MTDSDKHIVETLFEERAEHLMRNPLLWPLVRRFFYPVIRFNTAVHLVDQARALSGAGAFEFMLKRLQLDVHSRGLERVPREGPVIIIPNHPTGITDGLAVWQALRGVRDDLAYFANRDAIRAVPSLSEVIIPVEWVEAKRTKARSRETLHEAVRMFQTGRAVVLFPSGRLAGWQGGKLVERPWMNTPLTFARKFNAPLLPVHISARNSRFYYWLGRLNEELKNMTLFSEMLNKEGARYDITFGDPIDAASLPADPSEATALLKEHVEHGLPSGRQLPQGGRGGRRPARPQTVLP